MLASLAAWVRPHTVPRPYTLLNEPSSGRIVDLGGMLALVSLMWLAWSSHHPPIATGSYLVAIGGVWCGLAIACFGHAKDHRVRVLVWACVLRLAAAASLPIYEDDDARYLWDGWRMIVSGDPYSLPPSAWFADAAVPGFAQDALDRINHPTIPTIYGPVCEFVFAAAHVLAPGRLWSLLVLVGAAELLTLALVTRLVRGPGLLLYAWCPLVLQETWCSVHPDALAILPAVAALLFHQRQRPVLAGICLGLALATRIQAFPVVMLLLLASTPRTWIACVVSTGLCYLPFLARGIDPGLATTLRFQGTWEYNSFGFAILSWCVGAIAGRLSLVIQVSGILALWWYWRSRPARPALPIAEAVAWALLWSAVVNPWYVLWLVPFVAMRPAGWSIMVLVALPLSYVHGVMLADGTWAAYDHPWWVRPAEAAVIGVGFLWDWRRRRQQSELTSEPQMNRAVYHALSAAPLLAEAGKNTNADERERKSTC